MTTIALKDRLHETSETLYEIYDINERRMSRFLPAILSMYSHYSDHGVLHAQSIIASIERILGEKRIELLSPADIWMVLNCAYMHDIGMILTDDEVRKVWKTPEYIDFLNKCSSCSDEDLKRSALDVLQTNKMGISDMLDWPVKIKQDVILLTSEFFRGKHGERVFEHTSSTGSGLREVFDMSREGIIPPRTQNMLSSICMMHTSKISDIMRLPKEDSLLNFDLHPRFVAVLLRLGDLCDMENGRFNLVAASTFGHLTKTNLVHYFKHQSLKELFISSEKISIKVDVNFKQIEVELEQDDRFKGNKQEQHDICHQIVSEHQKWFDWLNAEIDNLKLHWNKIAPNELDAVIPDVDYDILVDGKPSVSSHKNLRFNFSATKAFDLIQGYSLYDDQLVFVRELVQNSLDALKIQFGRDLISGRLDYLLKEFQKSNNGIMDYSKLKPFDFDNFEIYDNYNIKVLVDHDELKNKGKFTIIDNGIGISATDLQQNIINTGESWESRPIYRSEIERFPKWLQPTGSFGIGLHSAFALTDVIHVKTKTEFESESNEITMYSGKKDGFVFMYSSGEKLNRGTEISFEVDLSKYRGNFTFNDDYPFRAQPDNPFAALVQSKIKTIFISPLFPIYVNSNSDNEKFPILARNANIAAIFDKKLRNYIFEKQLIFENKDYAISDFGSSIIIWDNLTGCFYSLAIKLFNTLSRASQICCKGVLVTHEQIFQKGPMHLYFADLTEGNSREIVNVARNQIMDPLISELASIIKEGYVLAAKVYQAAMAIVFESPEYKMLVTQTQSIVDECNDLDFESVIKEKIVGKPFAFLAYLKLFNIDKMIILESCHKINKGFDKVSTMKEASEFVKNVDKIIIKQTTLLNQIIYEFIMRKRSKPDGLDIDSYISEFGFACGNTFAVEFIQVFDNDKNSFSKFSDDLFMELGYSFGNKLNPDLFKKLDSKEIVNCLNEFCTGFGNAFGSTFDDKAKFLLLASIDTVLEKKSKIKITDSRNYISPHEDANFASEFNSRSYRNYITELYLNSVSNENMSSKLAFYYKVPLFKIIYLSKSLGIIDDEFYNGISQEIECYSGFDFSFGFFNTQNVEDIINAETLTLPIERLDKALSSFSYINQIPCDEIEIKENQLILLFQQSKLEKRPIRAESDVIVSFFRYLFHIYQRVPIFIPSFTRYNSITIKARSKKSSHRNIYPLTQNYNIVLWDSFDAEKIDGIRKELKENPDEMLLENKIYASDEVQNLIKYIARNRINSETTTYSESLSIVKSEYKILINDVIKAITLD